MMQNHCLNSGAFSSIEVLTSFGVFYSCLKRGQKNVAQSAGVKLPI